MKPGAAVERRQMLGPLRGFPPLAVIALLGCCAMVFMALVCFLRAEFPEARGFLLAGLVSGLLIWMAGVAVAGRNRRVTLRGHLVDLALVYVLVPIPLALPLWLLGDVPFSRALADMVGCLTTTGADFANQAALPPSLEIWRAVVAWLGGLLMLTAALAIFLPLGLGGFEIEGDAAGLAGGGAELRSPASRWQRAAAATGPIYVALTATLALGLAFLGDAPMTAFLHAMATISTSGISPSDPTGSRSGHLGEALILLFLLPAFTRQWYMRPPGSSRHLATRLRRDPELRLASVFCLTLSFAILLAGSSFEGGVAEVAGAFWGALFTCFSFLATLGFQSADWTLASDWEGGGGLGLILLGLAAMGGGVATTAGGVKLLRVLSLLRHGSREIDRLAYPSSVASGGLAGRRLRREGAMLAWVVYMLFLVALSATWLALSLTGIAFIPALTLAVAALSTTGPAVLLFDGTVPAFHEMSGFQLLFLSAAMILGRLETLAIVALANPQWWRS